jgi:hypothetical protein
VFAHPDTQPAGRRRLLDETVRLLADLPIAPDAGTAREGDWVSVRASARSAERAVQLRVTCYAHGHRLTDWERLRLVVAPADQPDQLLFLPPLDARGQTQASLPMHAGYLVSAFHRLPYRFRLGETQTEQTLHQQQVLVLDQSLGGPIQTRATSRTETRATTPPDPTLLPLDQPRRFDLGEGVAIRLSPHEPGLDIAVEAPASAPTGARMELLAAVIDDATDEAALLARTALVLTPEAGRLVWPTLGERLHAEDAFSLFWRLTPPVRPST